MVISVILAAGKGTRMKSDLPKVLHPVLGISMIKRVVSLAESLHSSRILVIVGYKAELIREELRDNPRVEFIEQKQQLGTAHAILQCRDALRDYDGPLVVLSGDTPFLRPTTVNKLLTSFHSSRSIKTVFLTGVVANPTGLGRIMRNMRGDINRIVEEKDATDEEKLIREVNMGIYVFDCKVLFETLPQLTCENKQNEYYLTDVVERILRRVEGIPVDDVKETIGINTVEQLREAEAAWEASI
jgi:UDP-N-acetylglucosamine diphosphorylase/glucosamine-1-phosphate N-acetyltransferase